MAAMGQLRGWALLLLLMPGLASAEEEAGGGEGDKAVGLTMMGAIFMIMGILYLAHWPDHDIRKITWSTINNTISIFCAVILFKNVSQVCSLAFSSVKRTGLEEQLFWNRVFTAFWYCLLFFTIFCWSGGLGRGLQWRKDVIKRRRLQNLALKYSTTKPSLEQMSERMRACLCLAHTTGFAGLYGWGMKTNTDWYNDSPWHCASLIPEAIVWYYCVLMFLMLCRRWLMSSGFVEKAKEGGNVDRLLAQAEEQLEDGENDFLGLFLSFLIVMTVRFAVGGHLPNEEGEEGEFVFKHTPSQVAVMYLISVVFFFAALAVLRQRHFFAKEHKDKKVMIETKAANPEEKGEAEEEEDEDEEEEENAEHVAFTWLAGKIWSCVTDEEWHVYLRALTAQMFMRLINIGVNMLSFSFAWCFMYATQWLLAPFFKERELVLGIVLAIVITILSCILVYVLDKIADDSEEESTKTMSGTLVPEEEDVVCRKLMESTGILIGFVWEQCFDVAVAGVAGEHDIVLKPCLALLTVTVILPVWFWYIIPMEISGGYILGIMPQTMSWRLKHMDLDTEPSTRVKVKEQLQGVLSVLKNRNPKLLREVLTEWNAEHGEKSLPYQPPPAVLEAPVRPTTPAAAAAPSDGESPSRLAPRLGFRGDGTGL